MSKVSELKKLYEKKEDQTIKIREKNKNYEVKVKSDQVKVTKNLYVANYKIKLNNLNFLSNFFQKMILFYYNLR